ncbi:MAG: hypothetical protein ACK5LY_05030 [Lachnospirales bacterium]
MKWDKAKNLIIVFLIIMNVFLYFANYYYDKKYSLSTQQEKNIITVLGENKISMYANMPDKNLPMASLIIAPSLADYDRNKIADNFLGSTYTKSENGDIQTFTSVDGIITFENGFFYMDFLEPLTFVDNPKEYIKKFGKPLEDFVLDKVSQEEGYTIYEYREKYKNTIVYTNRIEITTKDNNIYNILGFFGENDGYSENPKDIISADMALFTFIKTAKEIYGDTELFIEGVDVVYYQEEYFPYSENEFQTNAMPCYRIYVQDQSVPFIINAYTNKVINY